MNQKRLNQDIEYKDVCLKENNKKRQKRIYAFLMNCAAPAADCHIPCGKRLLGC